MKKTLKKLTALAMAVGLAATMTACDTGDGAPAGGSGASASGGLKVYTFEAENTDLRGKSGPGASGEASGTSMASTSDDPSVSGEDHGFVTYLYQDLRVGKLCYQERPGRGQRAAGRASGH